MLSYESASGSTFSMISVSVFSVSSSSASFSSSEIKDSSVSAFSERKFFICTKHTAAISPNATASASTVMMSTAILFLLRGFSFMTSFMKEAFFSFFSSSDIVFTPVSRLFSDTAGLKILFYGFYKLA